MLGFVTSVEEVTIFPFALAVYHPLKIYPRFTGGSAGRVEYVSPNVTVIVLPTPAARVPPPRSNLTSTCFAIRLNVTAVFFVIFESVKISFVEL